MAFQLGHVTINGVEFPVEKLALRKSGVEITFTVPPGPAFSGCVTVFGEDGRGCWQGGAYNFPDRTGHCTCHYIMRLAMIISGDVPADVEVT